MSVPILLCLNYISDIHLVENVVKIIRNVLSTRFDQIHVKQITYAIQFICMNVTAQPIYP